VFKNENILFFFVKWEFFSWKDLPEFILLFFNFVLMIGAIFVERNRYYENIRDTKIFMIICSLLYICTTLYKIITQGSYEFIFINLVEFVIVIGIAFNSYQLYQFLLEKKMSQIDAYPDIREVHNPEQVNNPQRDELEITS